MRRTFALALKLLLATTIFSGTLELALRLVPALVPTSVLVHFEPGMRTAIARGRLATHDQSVVIERDDGGPELRIWKPLMDMTFDYPDAGATRVVRTDEMGFCNPPGRYGATETLELITIGDSFTWCHAVAVEQAWPYLLGRATGLSSYNLGRGRSGTYEELQILKRFGLPRSPRIVVLNVYEGNDTRDALFFKRYRAHPASAVHPADAPRHVGGWRTTALGRNSYALNLVLATASYVRARTERWFAEEAVDFRYRVELGGRTVEFNPHRADVDEVVCARQLARGDYDLSIFDEALAEFAALARQHGFRAVLSYTPSAHTVYRDHVTFHDPTIADDLRRYSDEQRRYFAAKAAELDLVFIDLTPPLVAAANQTDSTELLYFPTSLHYAPRGHEIVARVIADRLAEPGPTGTPTPQPAGSP